MWDTKRTRSSLSMILSDADADSRADRIVRNGFWCPTSLPKPTAVIDLETWRESKANTR